MVRVNPQRWTIVCDGDSREYLCPVHLADEAIAVLQDGDEPMEPPYVFLIEGGDLTFELPEYDGKPVVYR